VLIIGGSKLHYAASGIITPVGGRPVHGLREDSQYIPVHVSSTVVLITRRSKLYYTASEVESPLSTCAPDGHLQGVMISDAV